MTHRESKEGCQADPYENYRFRLIMDNRPVMGMSEVDLPPASPAAQGQPAHEAIVLRRGITIDEKFDLWARNIQVKYCDSGPGEAEGKRDLVIEARDEKGQVKSMYWISGCRVSEYVTKPELDAGVNAIAVERLKLENDGWEVDL